MKKKELSATRIERMVDHAMQQASAGLQIPLSKLNEMGRLCRVALCADQSLEGQALVDKCRAVMVQLGAVAV